MDREYTGTDCDLGVDGWGKGIVLFSENSSGMDQENPSL